MNENVVKRLAFIRYLYDEAVRQSEKAEPMCGASVLGFHDAVELFLVLACEHLDAKKPRDFMAHWEEIRRKLPVEIKRKLPEGLTQKTGMERVNKARVNLKHYGNMPARSAVQEYRSIATLFFEENTPTVFGVEFGGISMVYLVRHLLIKTDLEEAEELRNEGDLEGAIGKVAIAFYRVLEDYKKRNPLFRGLNWPTRSSSLRGSKYGGPVVSSRFQRGEADKDGYAREKISEILEQTDALKKAVEPMHDAMVALALDLDYGGYQRFLELTPPVAMMAPEGTEWVHPSDRVPAPMPHRSRPRYITMDSYRFCFDFVIEAVLRTQAR